MNQHPITLGVAALCISCASSSFAKNQAWQVASQQDWQSATSSTEKVKVADGLAKSSAPASSFTSKLKTYKEKRSAKSITFKQTKAWHNWKEIPNVGLDEIANAQVFLPVKDGDYWLFGRHSGYAKIKVKGKKGEKTKYLPTEKSKIKGVKGYHAWHSTDMKTWKHCGPITDDEGGWMTTAEYADGKFYFYYDKPNDQDPHLVVDSDIMDGKVGKKYNMVLDDPTNGSDCAVIRDEDGTFHIIFEDWSYNDAKAHSWDAPVAGHAVSPDGIQPFKILDKPAVDERTTPTDKVGEYKHSSSKSPLKYQIHEPEQNAYGDWTAVKVGGQYYLFCDNDPVGGHIKIGCFVSDSLDEKFEFVGEFGNGHPDPTVGFAEGQFYLIQQQGDVDFVSPGPWVPGVEARVGVDTSGNGKVDQWSDWSAVAEKYSQKPGFSRIVETAPAQLDLGSLPEGFGFSFEYRTKSIEGQAVNVSMDQVELTFK